MCGTGETLVPAGRAGGLGASPGPVPAARLNSSRPPHSCRDGAGGARNGRHQHEDPLRWAAYGANQ